MTKGGRLTRPVNKIRLDPATSQGEYIGLTLIEPEGGQSALRRRSRGHLAARTRQLYYEDGFQEFADRGGRVGIAPIGQPSKWVEVDDHADLARAREVACRC